LDLVVISARLQDRIHGSTRATVTSVAGLGTDLASFLCYAAWTLGGVLLTTALLALLVAALPRLLRDRVARVNSDPQGRGTNCS
jgi:hypothetical protein